ARVVGSAADDDDARGVCQLAEQTLHEREVAKVVDAERHLDSVLGPLHARHHLHAGVAHYRVQRRKCGGANVFGEGAHRRQRREVDPHYSAALRFAELLDRFGAAAGIGHRKHDVQGRVAAQQCSCALASEPRAGAGDDGGPHVHFSSNRIGMSAVTAADSRRYIRPTSVPSGSRCSAKNTPSESATASAVSSVTTRSALAGGASAGSSRVIAARNRLIAVSRTRRTTPATAGSSLRSSDSM